MTYVATSLNSKKHKEIHKAFYSPRCLASGDLRVCVRVKMWTCFAAAPMSEREV